jgi:hypothetical protein
MEPATAPATFSDWLAGAGIPESRLGSEQVNVLRAAHRFRQAQGSDYYSMRILGHFLLHSGCGLKVARVARLLGISRPTASRQQALSSRQAIQQAHHRMDGRPRGKLLPRFAGPIAAFLVKRPDASRAELIDHVEATFGARVSRVALYKFLKRYGLDRIAESAAGTPAPRPQEPLAAGVIPAPLVPAGVIALPPLSTRARNTPGPSC